MNELINMPLFPVSTVINVITALKIRFSCVKPGTKIQQSGKFKAKKILQNRDLLMHQSSCNCIL